MQQGIVVHGGAGGESSGCSTCARYGTERCLCSVCRELEDAYRQSVTVDAESSNDSKNVATMP